MVSHYTNKAKWKKKNQHNNTHLVSVDGDSIDVVTVGRGTYGGIHVLAHACTSRLSIGSFCSIAPKVTFILGSEHPINNLSTFPFKVHYLGVSREAISKGDIVVGDDVWIGYGVTILSGICIGQGSIIAAGSVVTHDVPPYTVYGGVPAKFLRYRHNPDIIKFLLTLDYEKLTDNMISEHIEDLYKNFDQYNNSEIERIFEWFPKRSQ